VAKATRPTLLGLRAYIFSRTKEEEQLRICNEVTYAEAEHQAAMLAMSVATLDMASCKDLVALQLAHKCDKLAASLEHERLRNDTLATRAERLEEMEEVERKLAEAERAVTSRDTALAEAQAKLEEREKAMDEMQKALQLAQIQAQVASEDAHILQVELDIKQNQPRLPASASPAASFPGETPTSTTSSTLSPAGSSSGRPPSGRVTGRKSLFEKSPRDPRSRRFGNFLNGNMAALLRKSMS